MTNLNNWIIQNRKELERHPPGDAGRAATLYKLADNLKTRFTEFGEKADLNEAIDLHRLALDLRPAGHLDRPSSLRELAVCLWKKYSSQSNAISDLEEVVYLNRAALELCPPGHSGRASALHNLAFRLKIRFSTLSENADLDEAIMLHREALDLPLPSHSDRSSPLSEFAVCLWKRYGIQNTIDDLEEAIFLNRAVLELRPLGHPSRAIALHNVADTLKARFVALGENADLNEAIALHQSALDLRPASHPHRSSSLHELAGCFWKRYNNQSTIPDLDEVILLNRDEIKLYPPNHSSRITTLHNLANNLRIRFDELGNSVDLEEAITLHRSVLDLRPDGHSNRSSSLHELAVCYLLRYKKQATMPDLEEALLLNQAALNLRSSGHFGRAATLYNLADTLRIRFIALCQNADLDEAITFHRQALDLRPADQSVRSTSLKSFVDCLSSRIEEQGAAAGLDDSMTLNQAIMELYHLDHCGNATSFSPVLHHIQERLEQLDTSADLNERILLGRAILALCKPGDSIRTPTLQRLASDLFRRFQKAGTITDLQEAVKFGRTILDLHPPGSPDRAVHLNTLVICLREMLDKFGEAGDYNEVVSLAREALKLLPAGDPDRVSSLCGLASFLSVKFRKDGDLDVLQEAIELRRDEMALSRTASSLHALALCLSDRFDRLGTPADIQEAITLTLSALELCPPGDADRTRTQKRLALYRLKKVKQLAPKADLDEIMREIMGVVYEFLESFPPRLLNTHTGILCDRDALVSEFEKSPECRQLLLLAKTYPKGTRIRDTVLSYFKYVTLSHRWGKDEPLLRHIQDRIIYDLDPKDRDGLLKLQTFCATAAECGYMWAWSDTCCIDKSSTMELAKAVASMFSWYRGSALTIVYLSDVSRGGTLSSSAWFTRGWTLQELLAPSTMLFYTQEWSLYKDSPNSNHKVDNVVVRELEGATKISSSILTGFNPGMTDARSRLQWASGRRTTEPEDRVYSLFGIFSVFLPIIPGESVENALTRLLGEIISQSGDISVLDWVGKASRFHSCFPEGIDSYQTVPFLPTTPYANKLQASLPITQEFVEARARLLNSLLALERPHFTSPRLSLPCIVYSAQVTAVPQTKTPHHQTYRIRAEGLSPMSNIILPHELKTTSGSRLQFVLVRPLPPTLLASFTANNVIAILGEPFSALLLEKASGGDYMRVASSVHIVACPLDVAGSIPKVKVHTLSIL